MEPLSLATSVVLLLAIYFKQSARELPEETMPTAALLKVTRLYEFLRAKFASGSYQGALLDGLESKPDDPDRQEILKAELAKLAGQDKQFAAELEQLVDEAQQVGGLVITVNDVGAVVNVNMRGQYVAGRDLTIGGQEFDPPPPSKR